MRLRHPNIHNYFIIRRLRDVVMLCKNHVFADIFDKHPVMFVEKSRWFADTANKKLLPFSFS